MIIRSTETETFIFENDAIVNRDIARAIIHADIQILHRELGEIMQYGIQHNSWGGDDQFFDYSPATINLYHAMMIAIHTEDNMMGVMTREESIETDGIDWIKVMNDLFDNNDFMLDIHTTEASLIISLFMFDAGYVDDDEKDELAMKRNEFIANYYAKGD